MFDRYAGDNDTVLKPEEMMYLDDKHQLTVPAINLLSLLCAENTKSVCRQFFGRSGKGIGLGIASYVNIEPFEIPILGADGKPIVFSGKIKAPLYIHRGVARLPKGIPHPKTRPVLAVPWSLVFEVVYQENSACKLEVLRNAFEMGGSLGIGTFRPFFGRYQLTRFEEVSRTDSPSIIVVDPDEDEEDGDERPRKGKLR
jgi:hypothetical protein